MRKIISLTVLVISTIAPAQNKAEILSELYQFASSKVMNKTYDIPQKDIWNAIYTVGTAKYPEVRRDSESKGILELYGEDDQNRETLTIEILGEKQPYRLSFRMQREKRGKYPNGTYTNWENGGSMTQYELFSMQWQIWTMLNGKVEYPEELETKVADWNAKQKKDKNRIVKGKDY